MRTVAKKYRHLSNNLLDTLETNFEQTPKRSVDQHTILEARKINKDAEKFIESNEKLSKALSMFLYQSDMTNELQIPANLSLTEILQVAGIFERLTLEEIPNRVLFEYYSGIVKNTKTIRDRKGKKKKRMERKPLHISLNNTNKLFNPVAIYHSMAEAAYIRMILYPTFKIEVYQTYEVSTKALDRVREFAKQPPKQPVFFLHHERDEKTGKTTYRKVALCIPEVNSTPQGAEKFIPLYLVSRKCPHTTKALSDYEYEGKNLSDLFFAGDDAFWRLVKPFNNKQIA